MSPPAPHLAPLRSLVSQRFGLSLPERFDRHLVSALRAAEALLKEKGAEAVCRRLVALDWQAPAWQAVIAHLTIRETSFFRQQAWWQSITEEGLRPLLDASRKAGTRRLRCLSLGCASGEEPYSLAIILDRLLRDEPGWSVEIVGVDLCAAALEQAQAGLFDARAVREVPPDARERWFRPANNGLFLLDERLRQRVTFRLSNLAAAMDAQEGTQAAAPDTTLAPADFVICRNVLIHMEPSRQPGFAKALGRLVRPGGRLAVSPVEATASWFAPLAFRPVGHAILFTRDDGAPAHATPTERSSAPAPRRAATVRTSAEPAHPRTPQESGRLRRARRLADLGLFAEARRLCETALAESPEASLLMALVCLGLGDVAMAQAAARRGLRAAPASPAAHYVSAIICLQTGETDRARHALGEAVRLLNAGEERTPGGLHLGSHLGIQASEVRQAARRLGVIRTEGGAHVRPA